MRNLRILNKSVCKDDTEDEADKSSTLNSDSVEEKDEDTEFASDQKILDNLNKCKLKVRKNIYLF